jgi:class 3 adenylate cyclase
MPTAHPRHRRQHRCAHGADRTGRALRISHDTYAQVRGMFEVEAQEPLSVKGVDDPIQSYLVLRAKPRIFRIGTAASKAWPRA